MSKMLQIIGGVAAAGVVAAGSTALTAHGLTNNAGAAQFVGGKIVQTVTGASVSSITYAGNDPRTQLTGVTFVTAGATGNYLTMKAVGGSLTTAVEWYCGTGSGPGANADEWKVQVVGNSTTCFTANVSDVAAGYYSGLTSMEVSVTAS